MVSLGNIGLKEYYFEEGGAVDGGVRMIATPSGWVRPPGKLLYRVPAIREAVRAQPGFKLLISDLSQIEIKLMTLLSQDPWLMAAVNSGKDMHCYMAADVSAGLYEYDILIGAKKGKLDDYFAGNPRSFHASRWGSPVDRETLIDELVAARSNVKSISFMIPYGATVEGIAAAIRKRDKLTGAYTESMDDALERAQKLLDDYFGKARVLKQYLERCKRNGIKHGMAKSPKGRIRHFTLPELQDPDYKRRIAQIGRWSSNLPMQCVAGETRLFVQGRGMVRIEDVVGEEIRVWDGSQFSRATVASAGEKRLLRVILNGGYQLGCSPDHKLLVATPWKQAWMTVVELTNKLSSPNKSTRNNYRVVLSGLPGSWEYPTMIPLAPKTASNNGKYTDMSALANDYARMGEWLGRLASDGNVGFARPAAYARARSIKSIEDTGLHIPMYDVVNSETERFAANGIVVHNSGCVDVLKPAAARLYRNLRGGVVTNPVLYDGARIMLLVHDEIVATARDPDHLAPVSELIKEAMTWAYNDIHAEVNGQMHYLSEIKNKVDVITADYWLKD